MFILDTNVVSALRRIDKASPKFQAWSRNGSMECYFLSAIAVLEIEIGILQIERRDKVQAEILRSWLGGQILPQFEGRIFAVDTEVALCCARLHVPDPRGERDALIAATALVHNMAVVTRNVADFEPTGVKVINPWA